MKVVLDANIIIAALLGSNATLRLLVSPEHELYAPHKIIDEIKKYKQYICEKSGQTEEDFTINFEALLAFIDVLDYSDYEKQIEASKEAIAERDWKDTDYLACALAIQADFIWSNDKDFSAQQLVLMKTTQQFMNDFLA